MESKLYPTLPRKTFVDSMLIALLLQRIGLSTIANTIRSEMSDGWCKRGATSRKMRLVTGYSVALLTGLSFMALGAFDARAEEGNTTAGAAVFKKCLICHSVDSDKNKVGPSLHGLFGRKAGSHLAFAYPAAMKAAGGDGLVWNETTLRDYLRNPKANVIGTKMTFPGLKDDRDITDLAAYIKQYSK